LGFEGFAPETGGVATQQGLSFTIRRMGKIEWKICQRYHGVKTQSMGEAHDNSAAS
jgi:hypothetical protein